MKRIVLFIAVALTASLHALAGEQLSLKDITDGRFYPEGISAVQALTDDESYAQISIDGKQIVKYSFRTGKQTGVLFDAAKIGRAHV